MQKHKLNTVLDSFFLLNITLHAPDLTAIIALATAILLLACSTLISASEVAFFSLNPTMLNELQESDKKTDKKILNTLKHPQQLLATILIANNFVSVAIILLLTKFTTTIFSFEHHLLEFVFHTVVITFVLLLFGEIMPKIYATQAVKKTATATVDFLSVLQKIFSPFVKLLVNSTSIVNRRLEKMKHNHSNISIDELSEALEITSQKTDEDTDILQGIIKFGNIQVSDIMTSRVDIVDVDAKSNYKNLLTIIAESSYSRIPVYSGNRDNIRGILYIKDLLPHLDKPITFRWQSLIRQAYYVPETKKIDDLLNEFLENKIHLALVVDEYGGISGLITLEDILEEIVGDISDEYDEDEKLYTKIDQHTFIFEAKVQLNDFYKITKIDKDDFAKITDEVETLAGLILELIGEIPQKGQHTKYGKYEFEVLSVDDRRIKEVKLFIKDKKDKKTKVESDE